MQAELVRYEEKERVAYLTLNRPEKRNAFSPELVTTLTELLTRARDTESVRAVVLRAEGKAFCAGADLAYLQSLQENSFEENVADSQHLRRMFELLYTFPKLTIAQVQGHAIAGGCGLASACDFIFSVPDAKFGYTEVRIGFVPAIVMKLLQEKVGGAQAKRLLLTGELFPASALVGMGLVTETVAPEGLAAHVESFVQQTIKSTAPDSIQLTKEMFRRTPYLSLPEALDYAAEVNARSRSTESCKRGIAAFLNKEKIEW
jgi:methylglutaconyl-CoA hydratase